ncbi:acyl-CoA dehydrogenase family protein, partial [Kibdelosporangium lantanae]
VAIAVRERATAEPDQPGDVDVTSDRVSAVRQFVPFAPDVAWILLVAPTRLLLIPADHPNVSWRRHDEIGRGDLHEVTFRHVPLTDTVDLAGQNGAAVWADSLVKARIRHAAYLLGLSQAALDETIAYARQRQQFGQPIGRFQALAFRLADATTRTEAARLLVFLAAWQADAEQDARLTSLEALSTTADLARHVTTEAIQLHGAIGMTEDHDAQLFYRRAAVDTLLLGRPTELRRRAAALLSTKYRVSVDGLT